MKKRIIIPVLGLLGAIFIGPKVIGTNLVSSIQDSVNTMNESTAYSITVNEIDSGWFATTGRISVSFDVFTVEQLNSGENLPRLSMDFDFTVDHGPIILNKGFKLALLQSRISSVSESHSSNLNIQDTDTIYTFNGVTSLFGNTKYEDKVANLSYTDPATKAVLTFSGMNGEGAFSSSGIQYAGSAESLSIEAEGAGKFDMQKLKLNLDTDASLTAMMSQGLYNSKSSITIDKMELANLLNKTKTNIDALSLVGTSSFNESSDIGNIHMDTNIAEIKHADMRLSDLSLAFQLNQLQGNFIRAYQSFSQKMIKNASRPEQIQKDTQLFLDQHLLGQLQASPEYNISQISGKINDSEFKGELFAKLVDVDALPDTLEDPRFWQEHAQVNSNMFMQKKAAEFITSLVINSQLRANPQFTALSAEEKEQVLQQQVNGTLNALSQQGLISPTDEGYSFTFELKDSEAFLNGNPMPL